MLQSGTLLVGLLITFLFLLSCGSKKDKPEEKEPQPVMDITDEANRYVDSIMATMSVENKLGQCLMPAIYSRTDASTLKLYTKYIEEYHVGGIVLMQGTEAAAHELAEIGKSAPIPLFVAIDAEWGLGMRLKDGSIYPKNGNIPADTEEAGMFDYGREIAKECREIGINMVLGPVVDVSSGPRSVMGKRSFGTDPELVSNFGIAYSQGLEAGGVISVAKHFPGHGSAFNDSHQGVARVDKTLSAMDTTDLRPFRDYINSGLSGIMAGHIQAKAIDLNGTPATVSMDMLTSLLRQEMGYNGLILTDAFDMGAAKGLTAVDALQAGADIVLCPRNMDKEYQILMQSLEDGTLELKTVNDRCRRILFIKYLFGILGH